MNSVSMTMMMMKILIMRQELYQKWNEALTDDKPKRDVVFSCSFPAYAGLDADPSRFDWSTTQEIWWGHELWDRPSAPPPWESDCRPTQKCKS